MRPATVRTWVHRAKAPVLPVALKLLQPVDLSKLAPLELLEHDIAEARRDLQATRDAGVHTAIAPQRRQLRKMQEQLDAMKSAVPEDREATDRERIDLLIVHMRVKRFARPILEDRQARRIIEPLLAEWHATNDG